MHTAAMALNMNAHIIFYRTFANIGEQGKVEQVRPFNAPLYTSPNLDTTAHSLQKLCTAEYGREPLCS